MESIIYAKKNIFSYVTIFITLEYFLQNFILKIA